MRMAWAAALLSIAASATAAPFAVEGKSPLCETVLGELQQAKSINRAVRLSGFRVVAFRQANLEFQASPEGRLSPEAVEVARFDVDNDGAPEVVVKYRTWLRGSPGDVLWIFPKDPAVDAGNLPALTAAQFARMAAVEPMTPWPYASRGVWLADIAVLARDGVTYLSLRDTRFGDPAFADRRWIIAKYTGRGVPSPGYHELTDDLDVVCAFRALPR